MIPKTHGIDNLSIPWVLVYGKASWTWVTLLSL